MQLFHRKTTTRLEAGCPISALGIEEAALQRIKDMSLKNSVVARFRQVSEAWVPGLKESVGERVAEVRGLFDELNRSLASKALPEGRRERVCDLVLEQKSRLAAQGRKVLGADSSPRSQEER